MRKSDPRGLEGRGTRHSQGMPLARHDLWTQAPFHSHTCMLSTLSPSYRTWFFPQPAQGQVPGDRLHAIYASSYRPTAGGLSFPLAWNWGCDWVHAEDVTGSYLVPAAATRRA